MDIFEETLAYPTFNDLSEEDLPSMNYFTGWDTGYLEPSRHWCYLTEISMNEYHPFRPSALVKDASGVKHPVIFYLDNNDPYFPVELIPGRTMAILYAEKKQFMDLTEGIRLEETNYFKVFNCKREKFMQELKKDSANNKCFGCGKNESEEVHLSRCGRCKLAQYCGLDCQLAHWKDVHKGLCKDMKVIRNLKNLTKMPFVKHKSFRDLEQE